MKGIRWLLIVPRLLDAHSLLLISYGNVNHQYAQYFLHEKLFIAHMQWSGMVDTGETSLASGLRKNILTKTG